jgi:hypothetical protein
MALLQEPVTPTPMTAEEIEAFVSQTLAQFERGDFFSAKTIQMIRGLPEDAPTSIQQAIADRDRRSGDTGSVRNI